MHYEKRNDPEMTEADVERVAKAIWTADGRNAHEWAEVWGQRARNMIAEPAPRLPPRSNGSRSKRRRGIGVFGTSVATHGLNSMTARVDPAAILDAAARMLRPPLIVLCVFKLGLESGLDFLGGEILLCPLKRLCLIHRENCRAPLSFILLRASMTKSCHRSAAAGQEVSASAWCPIERCLPACEIPSVAMACLADKNRFGGVVAQSVDNRFHFCAPFFASFLRILVARFREIPFERAKRPVDVNFILTSPLLSMRPLCI
jgi:hypothetical protein